MKKLIEMLKQWFASLFKKNNENVETPDTAGSTDTNTVIIEEPVNEGNDTQVDEPANEPINEPNDEPINEPNNDPVPEHKNWKYVILLDNGHASTTPGKRSPLDKEIPQFFEYEFNRDIVRRLCDKLDDWGMKFEVIVPEKDVDVSLSTRASRANKLCNLYGVENCIFLSIHANAAGSGKEWMNARGWCCYTSKGETESDVYAEMFMREAKKVLEPYGMTIRKYSSHKFSWEDNFTVLVKTRCPAILTENLFYDNKDEVKFLQSEEGREAIVRIHMNAILNIQNGAV